MTPQTAPSRGTSPPKSERLEAYVEADLYEWVHRQATSQERSASSWLRWVLLRLREASGDSPDPAAIVGDHVAHD